MPSTTIVTQPFADQAAIVNDADTIINLSTIFDDPYTTGQVARFELYDTTIGSGGVTNVVLYDQPGLGAPQSVQNFIDYANDGDYSNSIIHRSVSGVIVQGGGFILNGLATQSPSASITLVPTNQPVINEFALVRSNTRGTLAYAKMSGDPNSATSQWFFNLADNNNPNEPSSLDNQNGGFTVFGEVISEEDLNTVDAIAALPKVSNGVEAFQQSAFDDLPFIPTDGSLDGDEDFVRYRSITVTQQPELVFSVVGNNNPGLVNAAINNNQLVLDYAANQTGEATITVRATNLQGTIVEDSFVVGVEAFNEDNYLASNLDLIPVFGYTPSAAREHYRQFGRAEQRNKDSFAEDLYIASNDDLINALGYNLAAGTQHYVQFGFAEGRPTTLFNPSLYLSAYSDLQQAFGQDLAAAARHYIEFGFAEGRDQLTGFNPGAYIASYEDLREVLGDNPEAGRQHYLQNGFNEGRMVTFEPDDYIASHPDLISALGYNLDAAISHYIQYGARENRATDTFNESAYLNRYADLQAAFGSDLSAATQHYIQSGFGEGRIA